MVPSFVIPAEREAREPESSYEIIIGCFVALDSGFAGFARAPE
jgi:hypothetical protein